MQQASPSKAVGLCYGSSALGLWGGNWARWAKVTLVQCCGRDCYLCISPPVSWSQISEVPFIGGLSQIFEEAAGESIKDIVDVLLVVCKWRQVWMCHR